jgi:type 2 lantibiotic biosynthesis protein LanM
VRQEKERKLRSIVARAAPLWDRSRPPRCPIPRGSSKTELRIRRWREVLGSRELLEKRLRSILASPSDIPRLLGSWRCAGELPSWAQTLASVLARQHPETGGPSESLDTERGQQDPVPFQQVLAEFVIHARFRAKQEAGSAINVFHKSALAVLERELLTHLSFVAGVTLGREFYEFRFKRAPLSAFESLRSQQKPSTTIYSDFVQQMRLGGLEDFLHRYPVLARLLAQSTDLWVQDTVNLCTRFCADFRSLKKFFAWKLDSPEGAIADIRPGLSDRHYGGQTVNEYILRTGERVIYKPRSVAPEIAFYRFVAWLNRQGLSLHLRTLRALDCGTHGWVEPVPASSCRCEAQVQRFYFRAGMLLAVLHALGVTDVHCENLIAEGEHPVVVDLETLLTEAAMERRPHCPSVLATGMLPRRSRSRVANEPDASALGAEDSRESGMRFPLWRFINTDQMTLVESTVMETHLHRPRFGDQFPSVARHAPSFQNGFRHAYTLLLDKRRHLLSRPQVLKDFTHLELRVLVRDTDTYARIHLHLLHPEFLKDGIDRSIELEWLARPLCVGPSPQEARIHVYEHERLAMERLDIPHFGTHAWRKMGHAPGGEDTQLFGGNRDLRALRRRLASLSRAACRKQLEIVALSVRRRFPEAPQRSDRRLSVIRQPVPHRSKPELPVQV